MAAVKFFEPEQLKVFKTLPADEINTKIHETFVPAAETSRVPENKEDWTKLRQEWERKLADKSFGGTFVATLHSADPGPFGPRLASYVGSHEADGIRFTMWDCGDEDGFPTRLYILYRADLDKVQLVVMNVLDEMAWQDFAGAVRAGFGDDAIKDRGADPNNEAWKTMRTTLEEHPRLMAYVAPRGIGPTAWDQSERKQVQSRRRFYLLGQTLDGQRRYDVGRAIGCVTTIRAAKGAPLRIQSQRAMAGVTLYATLGANFDQIDLYDLPKSHRDGPFFLNVSRYLDMPQAVAMAAERSKVVLYQDDDAGWEYPQAVAQKLGWDAKQIQIRRKPK
jgi:hypothetical protein